MCGIVGMAGKIPVEYKDLFKDMLLVDMIRGVDSTGVVSIDVKGEGMYFKKAVPSSDFLEMKKCISVISHADNLLIGHNRSATFGRINNSNAHPFESRSGNIVGVHNGTLKNVSLLPNHTEYDTDSEAIINSLDDKGPVWTHRNLDGSFALVWYNAVTETLNVMRNDERSLSFVFSKDGQTIFWASEGLMLNWLLLRRGIKIGEVKSFETGYHYEITYPTGYPNNMDGVFNKKSIKLTKVEDCPFTYMNQHLLHGKGFYPQSKPKKTGKSFYPQSKPKKERDNKEIKVCGIMKGDNVSFYVTRIPGVPGQRGKPAYIGTMVGEDQNVIECWARASTLEGIFPKGSFVKDAVYEAEVLGIVPEDNGGYTFYVKADSTHLKSYPDTPEDTDEVEVLVKGPDGTYLEEKEFMPLVEDGCAYCSQVFNFSVYATDGLYWLREGGFVCMDCMEDHDLWEFVGDSQNHVR